MMAGRRYKKYPGYVVLGMMAISAAFILITIFTAPPPLLYHNYSEAHGKTFQLRVMSKGTSMFQNQTAELIVPQNKRVIGSEIHYEPGVIYELPHGPISVRGLFFIAHACTHMADDFWVRSDACSTCTGLAEESLIVLKALSVGFVVIAMNSSDRVSGCWGAADRPRVASKLRQIRGELNLTREPLFALGTSSGGSFVWGMASRGEVDGAIIQVMGIDASAPIKVPLPLILNGMKRDKGTFERMRENFSVLQQRLSKSLVQFQECFPISLTVEYFHSRMPELGINRTIAIIDALVSSGDLDEESKLLTRDPTRVGNPWRDELLQRVPVSYMDGISLERGRSRLAKVLHRAWAFHEYCADEVDSNLLWMERIYFLENSRLNK